jgi:hypothetical protein
MKINFGGMTETLAHKLGEFCRKLKENNKENIEKLNLFFNNLKEKFEDGFYDKKSEENVEEEVNESKEINNEGEFLS